MYQSKVYEYKYDINKLDQEINGIKFSYFAQKRKQLGASQSEFDPLQSQRPSQQVEGMQMNTEELSQAALVAITAADFATSGATRLQAIQQSHSNDRFRENR